MGYCVRLYAIADKGRAVKRRSGCAGLAGFVVVVVVVVVVLFSLTHATPKRHFSAPLSAPVPAHDEDEENSCTARKAHYKFCFPVIANHT